MYHAYAADPRMRLNVGIRRRLAPLVENSRRRIELLNGLLFSLPGTPGHLLRRRDRDGRQHLPRRPQRRAHADAVDGRPQRRLLAGRPRRAVRAADHGPGLRLPGDQRRGAGAIALLAAPLDEADDRACAGSTRPSAAARIGSCTRPTARCSRTCGEDADERILVVANLARTVQPVELDLSGFEGLTPVEMLGRTEFPRIGEPPYFLTLGAVRASTGSCSKSSRRRSPRAWPRPRPRSPSPPRRCWRAAPGRRCSTATSGNSSSASACPVPPRQRWFAGKAPRPASRALRGLGAAAAGARAGLPQRRRGDFRRRGARALLPAAGHGVGRGGRPGPRAVARNGARTADRRPQGRAVRRVHRRGPRTRTARPDRLVAAGDDARRRD